MVHVYDIRIDPVLGTASVLLNGRAAAQKPALRVLSQESWLFWYEQLPELLFSEVNDEYRVNLHAGRLAGLCLSRVLRESGCREIFRTPCHAVYGMPERIGWLREAASELSVPLPEAGRAGLSGSARQIQGALQGLPAFYRNYCEPGGVSHVFSLSEWEAYGKVPELLREWIDAAVLAPFLERGAEALAASGKRGSFFCEAKREMLFRDSPVVRSRIPERLELGSSAELLADEFPESSLSLEIADPAVLSPEGSCLKASKCGTTALRVLSERGELLLSQKVTVFSVRRVTGITLSAPQGSPVIIGESFGISARFTPPDAENLGLTEWRVSPPGILKGNGCGSFTALAPGTARITVSVGEARRSIAIEVLPAPSDIDMPSELCFRLSDMPAPFHAHPVPQGSAARRMEVFISDPSVALYDAAKKEVIPVSEGRTELSVCCFDLSGALRMKKNCRITVLPGRRRGWF